MATIEDLRAQFEKHNGKTETPLGSNLIEFNNWYFGRQVAAPWCATFLSYCFWAQGMPLAFSTSKGFSYTPSGAQGFKNLGRWTARPAIGHVVFFYWDSLGRIGHVGWVDEVLPDGSFYSWEGNTDAAGGRTGGRVIRQHRHLATMNIPKGGGFGIPTYTQPKQGVVPMYNPPFSIANVVATAKDPQMAGGVWVLGQDGALFAFEGARGVRGANGMSWFTGRKAARIKTDLNGYAVAPAGKILTIVATSGEEYHLPA